ncbi:GxxExxY protein [Dyadobacter subterraneus]|uniref:GxxExxY protein n=1 Tax=Dyadobacter subterraneus TaxID=2773304 RepID=A0ABR9WIG2_9BACT|nr:GxxExxY protein [Dyadobacter subterraneus]MBE9465277.1 GxxExxY protein [Dyadobacter subterraneus]
MDAMDIFENGVAKQIYFCALKVHKTLGPGLLESAYEECLYYEIKKEGLFVEKQKALPLVYEDIRLEVGYRIDLLVENCVIVEIKAVEALNDVHTAQLLTYLKLTNCKLGLLINFNVALIKNGVKRLADGL